MAQTLSSIEQILQRHNDDLYRLALLLTPNTSSAVAAVVRAVRHLAAAPPDAPNEDVYIQALVQELPPERQPRVRRALPEWVAAAPDAHAATCVALARLPRQQRLVLGLATLQHWDTERIALFTGGDVTAAQALTRDALLALAPHVASEIDIAAMRGEFAPVACRTTRAALGMNNATLRHDPAVRGHLALCSACRAAEHDWQQLSNVVDDALRSALRVEQMPVALNAQLHDMLAAHSQQVNSTPHLSATWRRALLPLGIVMLIAVLVFPKTRSAVPETVTTVSSPAPLELIQRAAANLYQPPAAARAEHQHDVWHGQWQMRWDFSDSSYAMLNGDMWRDIDSNRHRIQLIHEQGGGPFEFELADGQSMVHYATTENYGGSLYPLVFDKDNARLTLQVPADEQGHMLEARLGTGAWGLAQAYLQRAAAASDLRSWGQQRATDGTPMEVLGFRSTSPLDVPEGAPGEATNMSTILLTIDLKDNTLREVRELVGPPGAEQVGRTIWRFAGGEWISTASQISTAFSLEQAWNGVGSFNEITQNVANPALPMISGDAVRPLANAIMDQWSWGWLPSAPPPGITSAALIERPVGSSYSGNGTAVYIGTGRYLALQSGWTDVANAQLRDRNIEFINANNETIQLQPSVHQQYEAVVFPKIQPNQPSMFIRLSTQGFSRAELLQIISGLRPLDTQSYQSQVHLFSDPQRSDPEAFQALLGALVPAALPPDTVRHITARVFQRHGDQVDPLSDPYHRPPGGGVPEEFTRETWLRAGSDGSMQEIVSQSHAADEPVFQSFYSGTAIAWSYDATSHYAQQYTPWDNIGVASLTKGQMTALRMLSCGGAQFTTLTNGRRAVVKREEGWEELCLHPEYAYLLNNQRQSEGVVFTGFGDGGPYLHDLAQQAEASITTWLYFDETNQPTRMEVRAGDDQTGTLIESWNLVDNEQVPSAQIPPDMFTATPPQALIMDNYTQPWTPDVPLHTVPLIEAATLVQTQIWQLPTSDRLQLIRAQAATQSNIPYSDEDIFERAVRRGFAVHLTYQQQNEQGHQLIQLYQGSAQRFGDFLRGQVHWQGSQSVSLRIGEREVDGWQVITPDRQVWMLFELDGTLIAVNLEIVDLLSQLEPVAP